MPGSSARTSTAVLPSSTTASAKLSSTSTLPSSSEKVVPAGTSRIWGLARKPPVAAEGRVVVTGAEGVA